MIYGVDIGGTKIEIAIFDDCLTLLDNKRIETPTEDYTAFLQALTELILDADTTHQTQGVVGIGMPGLVDDKGQSLSANIPCVNGQNVAKDLSAKLDRRVACENDCRCFALSEAVDGAGKGYETVFGAILGTGAAGSLVTKGHLLATAQGIAGEYGHMPLPAELQQKYDLPIKRCQCGLTGCLEHYISGPGLMSLHRHFKGTCRDSQAVIATLRDGDTIAAKTFDCYMDILGFTFASLVIAYDPHIIIVGGGLSLVDEIMDGLPAAVDNYLFKEFHPPPIRRGTFGDASGARGAAILARQSAHDQHI